MVLALSMCAQLHLILFDPMDCSSSDFSVHGDFLGKNIGVGRHFLTNPGIESASPPLALAPGIIFSFKGITIFL